MAIRNQEVKKILSRIDKVDEAMEDLMGVRILRKSIYGEINTIINEKELDKKYLKYRNDIHTRETMYKKFIEKDYKKYIDDFLDISTDYCSSLLPDLRERLDYEIINKYLIYPTGHYRQISHAISLMQEQINNEKEKLQTVTIENNDSGLRIDRIVHDEFILYQGLYSPTTLDTDTYIVDNIIPNFHRQVNDQNQTNISINFALPLDEIVEYITKIKNRINPRTLREFLDKKLQKADNLTKMKTTDEEHTINATRGDNPQFKLADMIYIYDMKQLGFSNSEIQNALYSHYKDKSTALEDKTISTYYNLAKDYIEKKKYKELITGKPAI